MHFRGLPATVLLCIPLAAPAAEDLPPPPCAPGADARAAAPGPDASIAMLRGASAIAWDPPACTGWSKERPDVVLAVQGTIRGSDSSDALLERLGAVSEMKNIRYWSVASGSWRPLVSEAFAMETQPQLLLLQKTMVVAEGVGRALNPEVNMWQLAQPPRVAMYCPRRASCAADVPAPSSTPAINPK